MFAVAKLEAYARGYDPQKKFETHLLRKEFDSHSNLVKEVIRDKTIAPEFSVTHHYQFDDPQNL